MDDHRLPGTGMLEAKCPSVETLAVLPQFRLFMSVDQISQNGVTDMGHVDTDLMGAACFQLTADVWV